jgi:chloramphenicol-sensitive protein RarD
MVPFSIIFQILLFMRGEGHLLRGTPENIVLLCLTGIVTAAPLLLFTAAAQRIPLSRVGFIQYLTPTCFFLLGRFVYREAFSGVQLASFICIWMALAIFSLSRQRIR